MTITPPKRPSRILATLKAERAQLTRRFLRGQAPDFNRQNARLLDDYFCRSFEASAVGPLIDIRTNPYAFVALGGYGRSEQALHSDIDLLLLFKNRLPAEAEQLVREIVYPLWDLGFEIGYATRTLNETLRLAAQDYDILVPLLDARFICGLSPVFSELTEALRKKIVARRARKIVAWLVRRTHERHARFGDSSYRLEPHIKEGQGGLRDYHTMLWVARILLGLKQRRDLEYLGILSQAEYEAFDAALAFIWSVRNHTHHLLGRKGDQLHFETQLKVARLMKFKKIDGLQPVEHFLSRLHAHMDFVKQHYLMFLYERGYTRSGKPRGRHAKHSAVAQVQVRDDSLHFTSTEAVLADPFLLVRIFEESARLKLPLSAEAKRTVKEFAYLIDEAFRAAPEALHAFEQALSSPAPTFNVLREMLNTGFLEAYLPVFTGITNRIQYDEYHLYPVDKHTLKAVQILKAIGAGKHPQADPLATEIFKSLRNRKALLWATLLHDVGKGLPGGDHARKGAQGVRERLPAYGLSATDVDTIAFLVEAHLLLTETATRRDLNDEETAILCARRIKDLKRLKMLYLLTIADALATGPKAWSAWTATLVKDLFLKVSNILARGELASRKAVETLETKKSRILQNLATPAAREAFETLYPVLSPRYLLNVPDVRILEDAALFQSLGERRFVWKVSRSPRGGSRTVRICAQDRPGLFSKIAGSFTLNNLDILDAQIFTWRNQVALDIFELLPPTDRYFEEETWRKAERTLDEALAGTLDLTAALKAKLASARRRPTPPTRRPHRVVIDNAASSFFTIVEVFTYDFPGLLFAITDTLYRCHLDIWLAKISTKIDQVVDVFYVRDIDGEKVDAPDRVAAIKDALYRRLPPIAPMPTHPIVKGTEPHES